MDDSRYDEAIAGIGKIRNPVHRGELLQRLLQKQRDDITKEATASTSRTERAVAGVGQSLYQTGKGLQRLVTFDKNKIKKIDDQIAFSKKVGETQLGTAGKVAKIGTDIVQYVVPGGAATKVAKVGSVARGGAKVSKLFGGGKAGARASIIATHAPTLAVGEGILAKAQDKDTDFTTEAVLSLAFLSVLPPAVRNTVKESFKKGTKEGNKVMRAALIKNSAEKAKKTKKLDKNKVPFKTNATESTTDVVPLKNDIAQRTTETVPLRGIVTPKNAIAKKTEREVAQKATKNDEISNAFEDNIKVATKRAESWGETETVGGVIRAEKKKAKTSLNLLKNDPTGIQAKNLAKKLTTNYVGKRVTVNGVEAVVTGNSFGRPQYIIDGAKSTLKDSDSLKAVDTIDDLRKNEFVDFTSKNTSLSKEQLIDIWNKENVSDVTKLLPEEMATGAEVRRLAELEQMDTLDDVMKTEHEALTKKVSDSIYSGGEEYVNQMIKDADPEKEMLQAMQEGKPLLTRTDPAIDDVNIAVKEGEQLSSPTTTSRETEDVAEIALKEPKKTKKKLNIDDSVSDVGASNLEKNAREATESYSGRKLRAARIHFNKTIATATTVIKDFAADAKGVSLQDMTNSWFDIQHKLGYAFKSKKAGFSKISKEDQWAAVSARESGKKRAYNSLSLGGRRAFKLMGDALDKGAGSEIIARNLQRTDGGFVELKSGFFPATTRHIDDLSKGDRRAYIEKTAKIKKMSFKEAETMIDEYFANSYNDGLTSFSGSVGYRREFELPRDTSVSPNDALDVYLDGVADHMAKVEAFGLVPKKGEFVQEGLEDWITKNVSTDTGQELARDSVRAITGEATSRHRQATAKAIKQGEITGGRTLDAIGSVANPIANLVLGIKPALFDIGGNPIRTAIQHGPINTVASVLSLLSKDSKAMSKMTKVMDMNDTNNMYFREGEMGATKWIMDKYMTATGMGVTQAATSAINMRAAMKNLEGIVKRAKKAKKAGKEMNAKDTEELKDEFAFTLDELNNMDNLDRSSLLKGVAYNTEQTIHGRRGSTMVGAHAMGATGAMLAKFMRFPIAAASQTARSFKRNKIKTTATLAGGSLALGEAKRGIGEYGTSDEKGVLPDEIDKKAARGFSSVMGTGDALMGEGQTRGDRMFNSTLDGARDIIAFDGMMSKAVGNEYTSPTDWLANLSGAAGISLSSGHNIYKGAKQYAKDGYWSEDATKKITKPVGLLRDALKFIKGMNKESVVDEIGRKKKPGDDSVERVLYDFYISLEEKGGTGEASAFLGTLLRDNPKKYTTLIKRGIAQTGVDMGMNSREYKDAVASERWTKAQKKANIKKVYKIQAEEAGKEFKRYMYDFILEKEPENPIGYALLLFRNGSIGETELKYINERGA